VQCFIRHIERNKAKTVKSAGDWQENDSIRGLAEVIRKEEKEV
jgi:hypothetical protein